MEYEDNIPLTSEDLERVRGILKSKDFLDFEIHRHYWLNGIVDLPRHGFNLNDLRNLFNKTELITRGFKRHLRDSFGYTLFYKISKNKFVKICYFFDESPIKIFNAIPLNRNLEKSVPKRYGLRI